MTTRDPRIEPKVGDKFMVNGTATEVVDVDIGVIAIMRRTCITFHTPERFREMVRGSMVLKHADLEGENVSQ